MKTHINLFEMKKNDFCHLRIQPFLISLIKVYSQNTASAYFMDKEKSMDISCKQQSGFCDYKNIISKKQKKKKEEKQKPQIIKGLLGQLIEYRVSDQLLGKDISWWFRRYSYFTITFKTI